MALTLPVGLLPEARRDDLNIGTELGQGIESSGIASAALWRCDDVLVFEIEYSAKASSGRRPLCGYKDAFKASADATLSVLCAFLAELHFSRYSMLLNGRPQRPETWAQAAEKFPEAVAELTGHQIQAPPCRAAEPAAHARYPRVGVFEVTVYDPTRQVHQVIFSKYKTHSLPQHPSQLLRPLLPFLLLFGAASNDEELMRRCSLAAHSHDIVVPLTLKELLPARGSSMLIDVLLDGLEDLHECKDSGDPEAIQEAISAMPHNLHTTEVVEAEEEMNRLEKLEKSIQDSLQKIEENLVASGLALLREAVATAEEQGLRSVVFEQGKRCLALADEELNGRADGEEAGNQAADATELDHRPHFWTGMAAASSGEPADPTQANGAASSVASPASAHEATSIASVMQRDRSLASLDTQSIAASVRTTRTSVTGTEKKSALKHHRKNKARMRVAMYARSLDGSYKGDAKSRLSRGTSICDQSDAGSYSFDDDFMQEAMALQLNAQLDALRQHIIHAAAQLPQPVRLGQAEAADHSHRAVKASDLERPHEDDQAASTHGDDAHSAGDTKANAFISLRACIDSLLGHMAESMSTSGTSPAKLVEELPAGESKEPMQHQGENNRIAGEAAAEMARDLAVREMAKALSALRAGSETAEWQSRVQQMEEEIASLLQAAHPVSCADEVMSCSTQQEREAEESVTQQSEMQVKEAQEKEAEEAQEEKEKEGLSELPKQVSLLDQVDAKRQESGIQVEVERQEEGIQVEAQRQEEGIQVEAKRHEEGIQVETEQQEEAIQVETEQQEEAIQVETKREEEGTQVEAEQQEEGIQVEVEPQEEVTQEQSMEEVAKQFREDLEVAELVARLRAEDRKLADDKERAKELEAKRREDRRATLEKEGVAKLEELKKPKREADTEREGLPSADTVDRQAQEQDEEIVAMAAPKEADFRSAPSSPGRPYGTSAVGPESSTDSYGSAAVSCGSSSTLMSRGAVETLVVNMLQAQMLQQSEPPLEDTSPLAASDAAAADLRNSSQPAGEIWQQIEEDSVEMPSFDVPYLKPDLLSCAASAVSSAKQAPEQALAGTTSADNTSNEVEDAQHAQWQQDQQRIMHEAASAVARDLALRETAKALTAYQCSLDSADLQRRVQQAEEQMQRFHRRQDLPPLMPLMTPAQIVREQAQREEQLREEVAKSFRQDLEVAELVARLRAEDKRLKEEQEMAEKLEAKRRQDRKCAIERDAAARLEMQRREDPEDQNMIEITVLMKLEVDDMDRSSLRLPLRSIDDDALLDDSSQQGNVETSSSMSNLGLSSSGSSAAPLTSPTLFTPASSPEQRPYSGIAGRLSLSGLCPSSSESSCTSSSSTTPGAVELLVASMLHASKQESQPWHSDEASSPRTVASASSVAETRHTHSPIDKPPWQELQSMAAEAVAVAAASSSNSCPVAGHEWLWRVPPGRDLSPQSLAWDRGEQRKTVPVDKVRAVSAPPRSRNSMVPQSADPGRDWHATQPVHHTSRKRSSSWSAMQEMPEDLDPGQCECELWSLHFQSRGR